jgi:hypothetical protein
LLKVPAIVLIAVPLAFFLWLYWRRTKSQGYTDNRESRQVDRGIVADEANPPIAELVVIPECPSKDNPLEEMVEESAKDVEERVRKGQTEGHSQIHAADTQLSDEADGTPAIPVIEETQTDLSMQASHAGLLPPATLVTPSEISQEPAQPDNIAANDHPSPGSAAEEEEAEITLIPDDGLNEESVLVEAPIAEVARPQDDGPTEVTARFEEDRLSERSGPPEENTERIPQRYRPPPQRAPRQNAIRPANQEPKRSVPSEVTSEIRVRLTFDRFGFCTIGLLPERTAGLDNEVAVKMGGAPVLLIGQEDWYQDLHVDTIGDYLQQGVELRGNLTDGRRARWLLSGRDLYVLASHQRASGFVSTNRLSLGRSDIVLCRVDLLHEVEAILNVAGCEGYSKLDESHGVPLGWVGLRSVMPKKAIALNLGSDPFYAIKPAPDIEIELEGGVRLRNSVWLAGYPPRIKLFGESSAAVRVLVDGKEGQTTGEGFVIADGYDMSGQHSVHCEGLSCSCSYSIEEPPDSWDEWPAYHFAQADICGPLVQLAPEIRSGRLFTGPMSNPLLLGSEPGQVFWCSPRRVALWKGFVPFDVVWALPAQPLRCDKKTARILQFANIPVALVNDGRKSALMWSNAILDASRKGLRIENGDPDSTARWRDYKKAARNVWRAAR